MQKVSEMQERDVNPPPGGRVVSVGLHPGACRVGMGTVVGTADGGAVVAGAALVLVSPVDGREDRWATAGAAEGDEQLQPMSTSTTRQTHPALRLCITWSPSGSSCSVLGR